MLESATTRPTPPTRPTPLRSAESAAEDLARALSAVEGGRAWIKRLVVLGIVALLVAGGWVWRAKTRPLPAARYVLSPITLGDVVETVQSTGTVQPVTQVQVGAQISGRIAKVYVDYNSMVHKGDVLAEIDPSLLGTTVESNRAQLAASRAQMARAESALKTAEMALARAERLRVENLASQADVDQARGQRDVAQAELSATNAQAAQYEAQLSYSRTNLTYTRIFAPIDGLVISRNIDPGQTVAASFTAPVLFVIAQDMNRMRVLAEIDEADVGKLKEGMVAEATVDAFPGEIFGGKVSQVRFNPNSVQGVVTYSAVIEVENPDLKLRPGMTATVTVKTREAHGVRRVPNSALRFKPTPAAGPEGKPEATVVDPVLGPGKKRLYLLEDATRGKERIAPKVIEIGISDGVQTELKSLEPVVGTDTVIDETDQADGKRKGPRLF